MTALNSQRPSFDDILSLRPALAQKYAAFIGAVDHNDHVPERTLELCRARISQIHGLSPSSLATDELSALAHCQWDFFSVKERAALVVAERIPYQHHQLEDSEVSDVREAYGDAGCVALLTALAFFDVNCRLNLTFSSGDN